MKTSSNLFMLPVIIVPALLATGLSLFVLLAGVTGVSASQHSHPSAAPVAQATLTQEPEALMVQPLAMGRYLPVQMSDGITVNPVSKKQAGEQKAIFNRVESRIVGNKPYVFS